MCLADMYDTMRAVRKHKAIKKEAVRGPGGGAI